MQITLNITEDSKVELVKENCELVQGECCFTDFVFNFPATIKGHAVSEYHKTIEFAECKELGECVKFVDEIDGDKYELNEACTAFKKIMVQIVLDRVADGKKITWKTVPFMLEFAESINANGTIAVQAHLLNLAEIKASWEAFVKENCFRLVYRADDIPLASKENEDKTIFYLGENNGDFEYGHYYRCVDIDDTCVWQDLTQDPSLEGVANGIREINKSQTMQVWVGDEIPEETQNNVIYFRKAETSEKLVKSVVEAEGYAVPNARKVNNLEICKNENGVLIVRNPEDIEVEIGGNLTGGGALDYAFYEMFSNYTFEEGESIYFNGEKAEIDYTGYGEGGSDYINYYHIRIKTGGNFEAKANSIIFVTNGRAISEVVIPQKKLLFETSNIERDGNYNYFSPPFDKDLTGKLVQLEITYNITSSVSCVFKTKPYLCNLGEGLHEITSFEFSLSQQEILSLYYSKGNVHGTTHDFVVYFSHLDKDLNFVAPYTVSNVKVYEVIE